VPNTSTITRHPARDEIEQAILKGEPERTIANRYSVSKAAIHRHKRNHLAQRLAQAEAAHEAVVVSHVEHERSTATDLLALVNKALSHAEEAIEGAKAEAKWGQASSGIREFVRAVELLARLRGELSSQAQTTTITQVNFHSDPNWPAVRALVFDVLDGHPELVERFREGLRAIASSIQDKREAL
jgi:hypothetical protein